MACGTVIEATRRRLQEGEARIARQDARLRAMEHAGSEALLARGLDLLSVLQESRRQIGWSLALLAPASDRGRSAAGEGGSLPSRLPSGEMSDLMGILCHALLHQQSGAVAVLTEVVQGLSRCGRP